MNDDAASDLVERLIHVQDLLVNDATPPDAMNESSAVIDPEFQRLTRCLSALEMMRRTSEPMDEIDETLNNQSVDPSISFEPQRIGRFTIERRLGSGGQGYVFCANDPELDRLVALKLPRPDILLSPSLRRRFLDEARFAARLRHPNLVTVYEVGEIGPLCYIASEYCEGCTLTEWLTQAKKPIDVKEACHLICKLAAAVSAMHQSQILHRDLKPSNVLLQVSKNAIDRTSLSAFDPKITDFGLARLFESEGHRTRTGALVGTPAYMSPEQARGDKGSTGQGTDIHALGVLLYEVLTGSSPFQGNSDAETLHRVLKHDVVPLRRVRRDVSLDLEAICHKCLEPSVDARYLSADDLKRDIERFLNGLPTEARPLTPSQRVIRWCRRRPAIASLGLATVTSIFVIAIGLVLFNVRLQHALNLANRNAVESRSHQMESTRANERANIQLYGTQLRLASLALEQGDHERARELLSPYLEGKPLHYLAGFETPLMHQVASRIANEGLASTTYSIIHPDEVYSVDFSPDGHELVTGSKDGMIRIWNTDTRKLIHHWRGHASCANCVRYSPDGRFLASGGCDNDLCLWQRSSSAPPQLSWKSGPDGSPIRYVAFSSDGRFVASGGDHRWLRIWDVTSGSQTQQIDASCSRCERFDWSPDGKKLAIVTRNMFGLMPTRVFDLASGEAKEFDLLGEHVSYSPDGEVLSILDDRGIHHVTLKSNVESMGSIRLPHSVHALKWGSDSRHLAAITNMNTLRLFGRLPSERHEVISIDGLTSTDDIALSKDGSMVAVASRAGVARITTIPPSIHEPIIDMPLDPPTSTILPMTCGLNSSHQDLLVCSSNSIGRIRVAAHPNWSPIDIGVVPRWVRASASGAFATVISDQTVHLVNATTGESRRIPAEFTLGVVAAFHFDDNDLVVIVTDKNLVRVLDDRNFSLKYHAVFDRLGDPKFFIGYVSPDGRWFAFVNDWTILTCVDMKSGATTSREIREFSGATFLHHSDHLMVLASGSVQMYDLPRLDIVRSFRADNPNGLIAVSPDDKTLAIASINGVLLTHLATGQEIIRLPMAEPHIRLIRFSRTGRILTAAGFERKQFILHQWSINEPDGR